MERKRSLESRLILRPSTALIAAKVLSPNVRADGLILEDFRFLGHDSTLP